MTTVIGINAYHSDAAACIVVNGKLIAAAEEERFRRVKHWTGFPARSVTYCLEEAGLDIADVDIVAINQDGSANFLRKLFYLLNTRPKLSKVLDRVFNKRRREGVIEDLEFLFPGHPIKARVANIEHHFAHMVSAHTMSPFKSSVTVSVDGFGDFSSAAWGVGTEGGIKVDGRVFFPHSLGTFYMAITQYLGFPNWGDEYKVMGLAPYGDPKYLKEMEKIVLLKEDGSFELNLKYFRHHKVKVDGYSNNHQPLVQSLFSCELEELLGPARTSVKEELSKRHFDIARSAQVMYEKAFFHLLNMLHKRYAIDELSLAGGCAMNSVANGKIYLNTPFKKVYIQSAAGDAGGALGAAFGAIQNTNEHAKFNMTHAYWGPHFSNLQIEKLLLERADDITSEECLSVYVSDEDELLKITAEEIAKGSVIGWFQGRMEWGPRALGGRSILGDPRRKDMKEILNIKIKRRESFRPFAPSILRECVKDWFDQDDDVPFMMQVYPIKQDKRALVPAVTHVDGSGRLQTVTLESNARYYRLIQEFNRQTKIPILLNTSFNENEPIVCYPSEALDCFLRTKMDMLVMENWIVKRVK